MLATIVVAALVPATIKSQSVELPMPSGKYGVGTMVFDLTDNTREETWTPDPNDRRRVVVQMWYPIAHSASPNYAPYIAEAKALKPSLEKYWSDMPTVRSHAVSMAPIAPGAEKFPVIVFSHGMNSARYFYSALLQDLASNGYIVAAVDHPYWSMAESFSDGKNVSFDQSMVALDKLSPDEIDMMMKEGVVEMGMDEEFVARSLTSGSVPASAKPILARADFAHLVVGGHSMGGMSAQRACIESSQFQACFSLDGAAWGPIHGGMQPSACPKPLLLLLSQQFYRADKDFAAKYMQYWKSPDVFLINGSKHRSFTDIALLDNDPNASPSATVLFHRIARSVRTFLDAVTKNVGKDELANNIGAIEGVQAIDLASIGK